MASNPATQMHTTTLGLGDLPVIMLHGWGQSSQALMPLAEALAEHRRVVLFDLPGFGRSPLPEEASNSGSGWGTEQYATAVKEQLDALGIDKGILLGHSFGGRISVRLAEHFPDFAKGLILVASHGLPRQRTIIEKIRIFYIQLLVKGAKLIDSVFGTELFKNKLSSRFGSRDYKNAGELRKTLVKTINEDLSELAQRISTPTLLLWGEKDTETPPDIGERYNRLIKDSRYILLKGKDHEPFKDVGSHLLASHIEEFLGQVRKG